MPGELPRFVCRRLVLAARARTCRGRLFGATAFTFCSFNLLHFVHVNAVAVIAHMPWLLYAMDRVDAAIGAAPDRV